MDDTSSLIYCAEEKNKNRLPWHYCGTTRRVDTTRMSEQLFI